MAASIARPAGRPAPATRRDRWPPALWLAAGAAIGASVWVGMATTHPAAPDLLQTVNRWLVRAGLPFFCIAFAASSLVRLWPSDLTRRLLRERRGIGLAWAAIQLTHAAAILTMFGADAETVPPPFVIAFGGTAFLWTAAMAATSNDRAQRLLGRSWGRLHRTGIWFLMFIYVYTYLGRVLEAPAPWPVFAFTGLLALVGLRAWVWRIRRHPATGPLTRAPG